MQNKKAQYQGSEVWSLASLKLRYMTLGKLLYTSDRTQVSKMRLNTSATTLSQKQHQLWVVNGISEIKTHEIAKVAYKIMQLL